MTTATIFNWGEICAQQKQCQSREQLHKQFDNWLNHLEEAMNQAKPTLIELPQAFLSIREELTQAVTAGLV